jgi:DNA-binding beta-propeller fold protein YncE
MPPGRRESSWVATRLLATVHTGRLGAIGDAGDAEHFLVLTDAGLALIDLDGHQLWQRPEVSAGRVAGIEPLAEGDLALVWADGEIRLLRTVLGEWGPAPTGLAGVQGVRSLAVSADGRQVALSVERGERGDVLVAPLGGGPAVRQRGLVDAVVALVWRSPGTLVIATKTTIQAIDTNTSRVTGTFVVDCQDVRALAATPDRRRLVIAELGRVRFLPLERPGQALVVSIRDPRAVAVSRDGSHVFVGTPTGIQIFTISGESSGRLAGEVLSPGQLRVGAGGHLIARLDQDRVSVYEPPDAASRLPSRRFPVAGRWAATMAITVGRSPGVVGLGERPGVASSSVSTGEQAGVAVFAWAPEGNGHYQASGGELVAEPGWRVRSDVLTPYDLAVSADGRALALAARNDAGRVQVFDSRTGRLRHTLSGGQSPVFDPRNADRLAVPAPGRQPDRVLIYRLGDPDLPMTPTTPEPMTRTVEGGIARLDWSPDGGRLAVAAVGKVVVWETSRWQRQAGPARAGVVFLQVAWSPDGRMLAATGAPEQIGRRLPALIMVFETSTWNLLAELGTGGGRAWAPALEWSPDSRYLLAPEPLRQPRSVLIWSLESRAVVSTIHPPPGGNGEVWSTRWSPDGTRITITHDDGRIVEHTLTNPPPGRARRAAPSELPYPIDLLARLGATAAAAGAPVALDLLAGLLRLTGGDAPPGWASLAQLRPVRDLGELGWSPAARVGIVAMLALGLRGDARFQVPASYSREELATALTTALNAAPVPPRPSPLILAELSQALGQADETMLTLLRLLGSEAVQADPTLPIQLRGLRELITPLTPPLLRLIGTRLSFLREGSAEGGGSGNTRAGFSQHGSLNQLLTTQIALPEDVFDLRRARDELLFRTRQGRLPPVPHSLILLMDDTPAAFGQVGLTIRACAHLLAQAMLERSQPCLLIRLGTPEPVRLERPLDLIGLWTRHSLDPRPASEAADRARALSAQLTDGSERAPWVVAVTHVHRRLAPLAGMREVRIAFPENRKARIPRAAQARSRGAVVVLPAEPSAVQLHQSLLTVLSEPRNR